jgi:hypothetical protein
MISHRSSLNVIKYSELGGNKIVTVNIEVPQYDLLSWITDIDNGVFNVEKKSYEEDMKDVSTSPWEPEQWITNKDQTMPFQAENNFGLVWEQLAKATAIAADAFNNMDVHKEIIQKSMVAFTGRRVLLTFDSSKRLLKKASLPEPSTREWHLPFISHEEFEKNDLHDLILASVAKCACFGVPEKEDISYLKSLGESLVKENSSFMKHIRLHFSGSGLNTTINGWVGLDEIIRRQIAW